MAATADNQVVPASPISVSRTFQQTTGSEMRARVRESQARLLTYPEYRRFMRARNALLRQLRVQRRQIMAYRRRMDRSLHIAYRQLQAVDWCKAPEVVGAKYEAGHDAEDDTDDEEDGVDEDHQAGASSN